MPCLAHDCLPKIDVAYVLHPLSSHSAVKYAQASNSLQAPTHRHPLPNPTECQLTVKSREAICICFTYESVRSNVKCLRVR